MAIGTPVLHVSAGEAVLDAVTTASFTPSADTRLFAYVVVYGQNALPTAADVTDSLGGSWNRISDFPYDPLANRRVVSSLFEQEIGGSPASMTVTATGDATVREIIIAVFEISGTSNDFSNIGTGESATGDPSVTLPPFAGTSIGLGLANFQGNVIGANLTSPSGYTDLLESILATGRVMSIVYDMVSPGLTLSWTSTNILSQGIALEIKEGTGNQSITGALFTDADTFEVASITPGAAPILGALYTNLNTFEEAAIGQGAATQNITCSLFAVGAPTVHQARLALDIAGALFVDADTFYGSTRTSVAAITGALYIDLDSFFVSQVDHAGAPPGGLSGLLLILFRRRRW